MIHLGERSRNQKVRMEHINLEMIIRCPNGDTKLGTGVTWWGFRRKSHIGNRNSGVIGM